MRSTHILAGIASAGLVAASLVLAAPANARPVNGTGGDDHLRGTGFSDTIRGFGGTDTVYALRSSDLIGGGSGRDNVFAGRGGDTVHGGPQGDSLVAGPAADTIFGGAGRDDFIDGPGPDTIYGGLGNDTILLRHDGNPDTVHCGPGQDVVFGATSGNTIAADCEELPPCHARNLAISKGPFDGAAGNFYQNIKITNVSDGRCRLTGFPTFTWRRNGHDIGWSSVPVPGSASTVVIRPGHAAYTTLHWNNTGAIPPAQCRAKKATGVHMTLPSRPHVYRIAISADVCTTKKYRPTAYPVRSSLFV
jgi:Ca2+-binding RTX toxin-like protein